MLRFKFLFLFLKTRIFKHEFHELRNEMILTSLCFGEGRGEVLKTCNL